MAGEEGRVRVTFRLPLELHEELKALALARGVTAARLVEEAVREKLERERARMIFGLLPRPAQEKLLGAAGGDELEAARLLSKLLDRALEELGRLGGANQQLLGAGQQPPVAQRSESRPF
jgi:hypothetical protein